MPELPPPQRPAAAAAAAGVPDGRRTLYLDWVRSCDSSRLCLNFAVMALRQGVLGGQAPRDLLPFSMMLDAEHSGGGSGGSGGRGVSEQQEKAIGLAVGKVLRAHHIPDLKTSDHLGVALAAGAVSRLVSVTASTGPHDVEESALFSAGEEVAFKDEESDRASASPSSPSNRFFSSSSSRLSSPPSEQPTASSSGAVYRYGRVARWAGRGKGFLVEDGPSSTRTVPLSHLFKLQSQREAKASSAAAAEAAAEASAAAPSESPSSTTSGGGNGEDPLRNPETAAALSQLPESEREELLAAAGGGERGGDGGVEGGSDNINRVRYVPPDEDWVEKEETLLEELRQQDGVNRGLLEAELPGSDQLLVKGGFRVQDASSAAAQALATATTSEDGGAKVRRGMDLVRVGNLGQSGVVFFFDRRAMPPPLMLTEWLTEQVVPALAEVEWLGVCSFVCLGGLVGWCLGGCMVGRLDDWLVVGSSIGWWVGPFLLFFWHHPMER
mmetsp:Transcript_76299/g.149492  ORF Transcript_76299/g.149492 Transcript_76299/m.149492 type:complete len:496 (+) Transcript_76299:234-1721(+)